jgi:hypothetical protein
MKIKCFIGKFLAWLGYGLCLNEIRKNLAANLGRSPLSHSYDYGSAGDRPTLFAGTPDRRFPLSFVPFMQYAS